MRITLDPPLNPQPGEFQVIVDGGENSVADSLDISRYFKFCDGKAIANIFETIPINTLPGPNQNIYRALPYDNTLIRIMFFGQNRIFFKLNGHNCFSAFFLHYDSYYKTVIGFDYGAEPIPGTDGNQMGTNHLILNFNPTSTDAEMSVFLLSQTLRPQGITRHFGVVQVRELEDLSGADLISRIPALAIALGNGPDCVHIDRMTVDPINSGETEPSAIRADYQALTSDWSVNGRLNHHEHFVMQTFLAHRLIELTKDPGATVRIYMPGSGVAAGNDFSGVAANNPNTYFVRGNRLFQATAIVGRPALVTTPGDEGNPNVGDIRNVEDNAGVLGHDTAVMAVLAGDGIGNQIAGVNRNISQVVLGTGKDAQIRVVRFQGYTLDTYKQLELSAVDANSRIHLVEKNYNSTDIIPPAVAANLVRLYTAISNAGKLIVGAVFNENANFATAGMGLISPNRATSRQDLPAAESYKKNVVAVGGAERVLMPNVVVPKRTTANFGPQLSLVAPNQVLSVKKDGTLGTFSGTSFTAPLVAGIAAELMLIDPELQQPANIVKVAELLEATTEDCGSAVGPDDDTGRGLVNFWKAALAAANRGLSAEGRLSLPNGRDVFFQNLLLKNEANTTWYGFDVRTSANNLVLWYRNNIGVYSKIQDVGQNRPTVQFALSSDVITYLSTQPHRNAAGRILPFLPFNAVELVAAMVPQRFWAGFSTNREELANKKALLALPLGKNPLDHPEAVVFELPLDDRVDLRRAQGATGTNKDLIKALVKEFTDFVLYIDHTPVAQVRVRIPNQAFTVGQVNNVPMEIMNIGGSLIPVGRWIIRGQQDVLAFDDVAEFGPIAAGAVQIVQVQMTCKTVGTVTLHATILRAANDVGNPVIATPVGAGVNGSRDGTITCT